MRANDDETSSLFQEEEPPMHRRRRAVPRTQMGNPVLRKEKDKRKPVVEWTKAILISLCIVSSFVTFVRYRRSRHMKRQEANFAKLNKCDLFSYPLWEIEHLKELNLKGCNYTSVPADTDLWSRFKSLKKIDLSDNYLADLPVEMSVLTSLEILFLTDNNFDNVPQVVGEMPKLKMLSFKGNEFEQFYSTHLPAHSLVWLILTNNKISNLDSNIGELKLLRKLMLSHNQLKSLPVELSECSDLELLRVADNELDSIPNEVLTLPKLAWISISGNPVSNPPRNIKKLIKESEITMTDKVLGSGASGTVYAGTYNEKKVAVKIFKGKSKGSDGNSADEAAINGLIDHPLAISALGVLRSEKNTAQYKGMVMDLLSGAYPLGKVPSFDSVTRDEGPASHSEKLNEELVLGTILNVATVLEYIHSTVGVSHGDVYLHNVLRDGKYVSRLSDWGASFVYDRDADDFADVYEKIEVLAFGRLIQDLFSWHLDTMIPDSHSNLKSSLLDDIGIGVGKKKMDDGPFKELVAGILHSEQTKRPNFKKIKETLESIDKFKKVMN